MFWQVNLTGGYYDAGDNVKFGWPMAFTVTLLSWAGIEYQKDISSVNQLGHLHTAIRWGTDFILECHPSSTTYYTQVVSLFHMICGGLMVATELYLKVLNFYFIIIIIITSFF